MDALPVASVGEIVAVRVRAALHTAPVTDHYRVALTAALTLPGHILSDTVDARWASLVWTCCAAAGGGWEEAVPGAAAAEIFMAALNVLDDEEDGEDTPLRAALGAARMLNVATGLLFLASQIPLADLRGALLVGILLDAGVRACAGQHADLAAGSERDHDVADVDAALAVAAGKSASLVSALCRLGAACAGADTDAQDRYAHFGASLGMMLQLRNDIAAVRPGATEKTDIALGRPTLPLASAPRMGVVLRAGDPEASIRAALWTGGPALLSWAVAETYRRHAADLVPTLTADLDSRAALLRLIDR